MNVLQLITRNELRGAEVFAAELCGGLSRRGHQVRLAAIYRRRQGQLALSLEDAVAEVELGAHRQGRVEFRAIRRLIGLLEEQAPDVVQANAFHALKYAVLARRLTRGRWPLVYRNISIASRWLSRPWQRPWGRWLMKSVAQATSVSDASALDLCHTYDFPMQRTRTIRRGVTVPATLDPKAARRLLASRIQLDADDHWQAVIHIGGFTPEKNHAGLLESFSRIATRSPTTHLVICGDGPLRSSVQRTATGSPFASRIHFLGDQADAADLATAADVLLLPSRIEGIPGVVLEAAARRTPAVATRVGGLPECIDDGHSGFLVEADDMQAMADRALELLGNPRRRREMGDAAHRLIRHRYGIDRCVGEFEDLYAEVAS